ncbi:hypothetical protein [Nannocystis pusilla]
MVSGMAARAAAAVRPASARHSGVIVGGVPHGGGALPSGLNSWLLLM